MKHTFFTLLRTATAAVSFVLLPSFVNAQVHLGGIIRDDHDQPLPMATISFLKSTDSLLVKTEITDPGGQYDITIPSGTYIVRYSCVGYKEFYADASTFAEGQEYAMPVIRLKKDDVKLKEVSIVARKPLIEVKADKMIMNVENSINATGSSALELLRKAPGVQVDNNEHISMKGKTGVRIYIDGKPSQLDAASLAAYLKGLNSSDIEVIEMISNPSAKYDASGNAGIINIKLKKNKKFGTNGSVNAGLVEGIFLKENGSIALNYRNKKVNVFGNAGYNGGVYHNDQNLRRTTKDTVYDMHSIQLTDNKNYNIKAGADFFASKKSTFGIMGTTNITDGQWSSSGVTDISYHDNLLRTLHASNTIPGYSSNSNINFNYRYTDTNGREVNVDADYGKFIGRHNSYQPNLYELNTIPLSAYTYKNNTPINIDIYSFKTDVEQNLWKGRFGYGIKATYVATRNTFDFYNVQNNIDVLVLDRSNKFKYTENVNAGYINYVRQVSEKWSLQAGLRAEQTNSEGKLQRANNLQTDNDIVKRSYINLFPSGALTWTVNKKNTLNLTYSRRIDRPTYEDLNPFEFKLDELTYQAGNAFLKPQITDNVELTHTFMGFINTTIGYSYVKDFATEVLDTAYVNNTFATYVQKKNIAEQRIISFNIGAPLPIKKWWNGYVNFWFNNQQFSGPVNGKQLKMNVPSYGAYMMHGFTLGKEYSAEISGWYNGPSIWGATSRTRPQGALDLGVQKRFLNKKLTVKISATDIFHTASPWRMTSLFGGLDIKGNGSWESQTVRLNITYMFGSNQIKQAREHKSGLEAEKKRLKG